MCSVELSGALVPPADGLQRDIRRGLVRHTSGRAAGLLREQSQVKISL